MSGKLAKHDPRADDSSMLLVPRLALLMSLGVLCACDKPPSAQAPAPPAAQTASARAISPQKISERSEQCGAKSREKFARDGNDGSARFAHHYSSKLDTCFYLLTVNRPETVSMTLIDINEGEVYGEFKGPAAAATPSGRLPATCVVVSLYCGSGHEWQALAGSFMED